MKASQESSGLKKELSGVEKELEALSERHQVRSLLLPLFLSFFLPLSLLLPLFISFSSSLSLSAHILFSLSRSVSLSSLTMPLSFAFSLSLSLILLLPLVFLSLTPSLPLHALNKRCTMWMRQMQRGERTDSSFPRPPKCVMETAQKRAFFIDNLLVRTHLIIEMIWWTGLAP